MHPKLISGFANERGHSYRDRRARFALTITTYLAKAGDKVPIAATVKVLSPKTASPRGTIILLLGAVEKLLVPKREVKCDGCSA